MDDDDLLDTDVDTDPLWKRVLFVWIGPLLAFVMLWFVIGWLRAPNLPDVAPGFELQTTEGERISLAELRGRTVVLNFWATWCGPCRIEGPSFAAFADNHPEITVLGMAADRDPAKVRKTGKDLGLTYPLVMTDPATLKAYGVTTFPTTVVIGPDGRVRTAHTGLLFRPQIWALTQL